MSEKSEGVRKSEARKAILAKRKVRFGGGLNPKTVPGTGLKDSVGKVGIGETEGKKNCTRMTKVFASSGGSFYDPAVTLGMEVQKALDPDSPQNQRVSEGTVETSGSGIVGVRTPGSLIRRDGSRVLCSVYGAELWMWEGYVQDNQHESRETETLQAEEWQGSI